MITNATIKAEIDQQWATIQRLCNVGQTRFLGHAASSGNEQAPHDEFYNLLLVLAYAS